MSQMGFGFDPARCFGCGACIVACQRENNLPQGIAWRRVEKLPPHDGRSDLEFLSWSCSHCQDPACLRACPAGAYTKDERGLVLHHPERCLGCRYCTWACPYGVPQYDERSGVVSKCHFCWHRLQAGQAPACVETCMSRALRYGPLEALEAEGATLQAHPALPDPALTRPALRLWPRRPGELP